MAGSYDMLLVDNDIVITDDIVLVTDLLTAVRQELTLALGMFKGEWFLNLDEGLPYYERILGKRYDEAVITEVFRERIARVPSVKAIDTLAVSYDGPTRVLSVAWTVVTDTAETATGDVELEV